MGDRAGAGLRTAGEEVRVEPRPGVIAVRRRDPPMGGSPAAPRRRLVIEQDAPDVDRAHAVDEAVVGLGGQGPATALQSVQQHDLPQRPASVQPVREEVGEPFVELGVATRRGQRCVADVVGHVEALRGLPRRPRQMRRARPREPHAIARQLVQAPGHVLAHARHVRCAALRGVGSNTIAAPKCIVAPSSASSRLRNIVSSGLSCSPMSLILSPRLGPFADVDRCRGPRHQRRHGSTVRTWPHGWQRGRSGTSAAARSRGIPGGARGRCGGRAGACSRAARAPARAG